MLDNARTPSPPSMIGPSSGPVLLSGFYNDPMPQFTPQKMQFVAQQWWLCATC